MTSTSCALRLSAVKLVRLFRKILVKDFPTGGEESREWVSVWISLSVHQRQRGHRPTSLFFSFFRFSKCKQHEENNDILRGVFLTTKGHSIHYNKRKRQFKCCLLFFNIHLLILCCCWLELNNLRWWFLCCPTLFVILIVWFYYVFIFIFWGI